MPGFMNFLSRLIFINQVSSSLIPSQAKGSLNRMTRPLMLPRIFARNLTDENLRRPRRFEFNTEISEPNSKARAEILKITTGQPKNVFVEALENLAVRTMDLWELILMD